MARALHPAVASLTLNLLPDKLADYGRQMLADVEACKLAFSRSKQATDPAFAIAYLDSARASLNAAVDAQDRLGACITVTGIDDAKATLEAQEARYRSAGHYTAANRRAAALQNRTTSPGLCIRRSATPRQHPQPTLHRALPSPGRSSWAPSPCPPGYSKHRDMPCCGGFCRPLRRSAVA